MTVFLALTEAVDVMTASSPVRPATRRIRQCLDFAELPRYCLQPVIVFANTQLFHQLRTLLLHSPFPFPCSLVFCNDTRNLNTELPI